MSNAAPRASEIRLGMRIDWDVPIAMEDGLILRADLFRPDKPGRYPVLISYGAFGKGLAFQDGNKSAWDRMIAAYPEVAQGSSCIFQNWEVVDPEKWVPHDYACLRIDARGSGQSPGFLDPWSPREAQDIYHSIAWAAGQDWCSGKVGMNGISYYAINQWHVAQLQPPNLAAICVWEGASDWYREFTRHGGIHSQFLDNLYPRAFHRVQYGLGSRGLRSRATGEFVSGQPDLTDAELSANRIDIEHLSRAHPFDDDACRARSVDFSRVTVPLLSAANWGGQGLHTRGNFEGYLAAASEQKWLEAHGDAHWTHFYTDYGVALQRRFFDYFLKETDTGWSEQPRVQLNIRHPDEHFVRRAESEWPLARTVWTKYHLHPSTMTLSPTANDATITLAYDALGDGLEFSTPSLTEPFEITGPIAARLHISADSTDADLFLTLRLIDPAGQEITFIGSNDPRTPVAIGWLRASHRKLDPVRSTPWRPWHSHDEAWPLQPGVPVPLDIEIWPSCITVPPGYRLCLSVRGKDYENAGPPPKLDGVLYTLTGVGPFRHVTKQDRPANIFGGTCQLHAGPDFENYLLLPIIPAL